MVKNSGIPFEIIEYLKTPLSFEALKTVQKGLGREPLDLIRTKDKLFKELGLSKKDKRPADAWLNLLVEHPRLLERPIVSYKGRYEMGRPPEKVLDILK